MRNLNLLALLFFFAFNLSAQDYFGLNAGFSLGELGRSPSPEIDPYAGFSLGVSYNQELSSSFALRITPTYMRFGNRATHNEGDPFTFSAVDGTVYYNSITTPVELRWLFVNKQFITSLNGGIGYTFLMNGKIDQRFYTEDLNTNEVIATEIKGNVNINNSVIRRNSLFFNVGLDLGYKISDNYIIGLNWTFLQGFTRIIQMEDDKQFGTIISLQFAKILN